MRKIMNKLIIPTGYMGSGSSAITDLICEFEGYEADNGTFEYVFLHCPNGLFDLEDKLQLEYYQLKKSFEGQINLDKGTIAIQPSTKLGVKGKDEKKTLDEIIELVNEKYKGDFTDGDKVVVQDLHDRLIKNKKLKNVAKNNDAQMFSNSMFDSYFNDAAQDGYAEAQQSYTSLFEDHAKYSAIKSALASIIYKELTKQNKDVNYIT